MDLTRRLRRWAVRRPRVLVVDAPGSTALRWTVEAHLDRRQWSPALSPAETDLLLVLGEPGAELARAVDVVWSQVPAPRHRTDISQDDDVATTLDAAVEGLAGAAGRGQPADDERPRPESLLEQRGEDGPDHGGMGHAAMGHGDHAGMDHAGMDHAGMDHGGMHDQGHAEGGGHDDHTGMDHAAMQHGGMDHSGHGGMDVAGLPLAGTAPDRDGLQLDVLQISLGPVLAGWLTGLLLQGRMQGDVLGDVTLGWTDADSGTGGPVGDSDDVRLLALDQLGHFLQVAGWPTAARDARRARHLLRSADRADADAGHRLAVRLARRVRRSRTLAWAVRGIGAAEHEAPGAHRDVLDRVRWWCDLVVAVRPAADELPDLPLEQVARLLDGAEVAAARLVVASLALAHPATHQRGVTVRV